MSFNLTFVWTSLMGDSTSTTSKIFSNEQNMNSTWGNTTNFTNNLTNNATDVTNATKTINGTSWWTEEVEKWKYGNSFKV